MELWNRNCGNCFYIQITRYIKFLWCDNTVSWVWLGLETAHTLAQNNWFNPHKQLKLFPSQYLPLLPQKWLQNLLKVTKISCLLVDWFLLLCIWFKIWLCCLQKCERLGGNMQFCYLFWQLGGLRSDSYIPLFSALKQLEQSLLPFSHAKHQRPLHVCSHVFVHVTIPTVPSVLKINPFLME